MSISQSQAVDLTLLNLTDIFGQKNKTTRMQAIRDLWAPSSDVLFVNALGVFKSHEAISEMVENIRLISGEGNEFVALGNVKCLKHDDREDIWVTKVKWGIKTASSGEMGLTGEDVLTMVGGYIKACYTFFDSK